MALVIGHSQVKYVHNHIDSDEVSCLCFPGYKIMDFLDNDLILEAVQYFSVIVLVVGTNDVPNAEPETILSNMQILCETIHRENPSASICVTSILPRAQNNFEGRQMSQKFINKFNDKVNVINAGINEACGDHSWLEFVKVSDFGCSNRTYRDMLSRDGLHLSHKGTQVLSSNIAVAISKCKSKQSVVNQLTSPSVDILYGPMLYSDAVKVPPTEMQLTCADSCVKYEVKESSAPVPKKRRIFIQHKQKHGNKNELQPQKSTGIKREKTMVSTSVMCQNRFDGLSIETLPSVVEEDYRPPYQNFCRTGGNSNEKELFVIETEDRYVLSCDNVILTGGGETRDTATVYSKTDRNITFNEAVDLLLYPQPDTFYYIRRR